MLRCSPIGHLWPLEHAVFAAKTKRADTASILGGEQIIRRVEPLCLVLFPFTAQLLHAFDVLSHDDTPCPPVGPGVDHRGMEERTDFRLTMKLWSGLEPKRRPWSETRAVAGPNRAIRENSVFATPLEVVMQRADPPPIARQNVDGLLDGCGT